MKPYAPQRNGETRRIKALLVDDDENAHLLIRRLLSKGQSSVDLDWAPTYEQGLTEIARRQHDVYLFDYRLGAHNGLELLREAVAAGCREPIIMLTAENPAVDAEAMRLGAADFLSKDRLDPALLERSIRYSIKHYQTLKALREREAQLAAFMQNVPCAVYMKDRDGRYLYVNETFAKIFNRPAQDWLGRSDQELWPSRAANRLASIDQRVLSDKRMLETTETIPQPDGPHSWLTNRFPILDENGAPIMVAGTALDITERKRLEKEIQEISEQEKRRIGQDLHDGLGQYLTGIAYMAKALYQKLAERDALEAPDAKKISDLVNQTVAQARELARGLCPVELENNGLQAALSELASGAEKLFGITCTFTCPQAVPVRDNNAAIHLYRIAQEAVNNAVKHGQSKNITVMLEQKKGTVWLTVNDDGSGLPKDFHKACGMGLRVMQYRAAMIGATVAVENASGGGTRVSCSLPNGIAVTDDLDTPAPPPRRPVRKKASAIR